MTSQIFSDEVALEDQGPQILLLWIQSVSIPQKMLEISSFFLARVSVALVLVDPGTLFPYIH